jgi:2-methylcitrate dehydratase PrpD
VLAASLALGEKLRVQGAAFLTAYIVGIEVACRLADAVDPRHYLDGFHPTGTLGTFGAAAAAAHLLKLNPPRITAALAIAGTFASGLRANRGAMAKALNAGRAAENGVLAASLAAMGFTGSADIFDDPMGFFSAACGNEVDRELLRFGKPFFFLKPGIAIKLYPCAGVLHPALDIILDLARRHAIDARDVEHVRVRLNETAARVLVYPRPRDGLQTKFSLPFAAAVAVMDREAGLQQFTSRRLRDAELHRLMAQVELVQSSDAAATQVEIALRSGRIHSGSAAIARGHPRLPASRAEIEDKFRSCAAAVLPRARIEKFLEQFRSWEKPNCSSRWLQTLRTARA